jgi:DNA-binding NtrC family response regulator
MESTRLLLVDDDDSFREVMATELRARRYEVITAQGVESGKQALGQADFDLALVDLRLGDGSGLDLLRHIRAQRPRVEVVVLTGHGDITSAIEAMREGAFDYLRKPCPVDELEIALRKALERHALVLRNAILQKGLAPPDLGAEFVGDSPAFWEICALIDRVAATDSTVLILGETGVGKDVIAKLIHARGPRREQPLVVVECAALHEQLLDSELFGHEKGAYTGALQSKHGLFEVADGGTIFLDEIGDVSLGMQVKLLRVLETGSFRHVGGVREIRTDVRVLAATNRDLDDMRARGYFRQDLFFRLNTIRIEVPPLRQRPEDIPVLIDHFLARMAVRFGRRKRFSSEARSLLLAHAWPGNAREMRNVVERAIILSPQDVIGPESLPSDLFLEADGRLSCSPELISLRELEREHITKVLHVTAGNRGQSAKILGISERTLYRKIREFDLEPDR